MIWSCFTPLKSSFYNMEKKINVLLATCKIKSIYSILHKPPVIIYSPCCIPQKNHGSQWPNPPISLAWEIVTEKN